MNKQSKIKKTTMLVVLAIVCLCIFVGYELRLLKERQFYNEFPSSVNSPDSSSVYEIDPETLLLSLAQKNRKVFNPITATSAVDTPLPANSFPWTQADYLKIAGVLAQTQSKKDMNGWDIFSMFFDKNCVDNPKGFDSGNIIYFKTHAQDFLQYQTITININPLFKDASFGEDYFPRPLFGWASVKANSFEITADEALHIAEDKGGKEARLKVDNVCDITINNSLAYFRNNDWIVTYSPNLFKIHIDPYSGKYKIINMGK